MNSLTSLLVSRSEEIVRQWAHRLHEEVSERYRQRPLEELFMTTSEAAEAYFDVLVKGNFEKIDRFIEKITQMRLGAGFRLSDVQRAFELYRTILVPILVEELKGEELLDALEKLNHCLIYTISRFSDYFQSEHERQIREHAEKLEEEVRRRTKELAESESKYRVLVEDINDGYFVIQRGRLVFANRAFCEMHGWSLDEVLGRPWADFVAPESLDEVREIYEGRKKADLFVYFRRHRDGRSLPTENKVKVITYQGRKAAAGICRDITERVEMERRVREAERFAYIGQLTTSLAHEIRNPLSSVKMNLQILMKKLQLDGNDKRRIEIMAQEIGRLERILEEMLDFARPISLNLRPSSISEVVRTSLEVLEPKIKEKGLSVRRRLWEAIPRILIDPDRLEQAFINVLLNAIEVLPVGGTIEISICRKADGESQVVEVKVEDDGPGVDPDDLPYLFAPFFSKKKGMGIGLTNVKKIVEAHGGEVKASLRSPQGMSISLVIPMRR
ncbi:MAG: hypothetical protein DRG31_04155 [Deltaproteobacteria bacterium]|nr:MAG: hypothetical protein DRG31_04155 [Deltaproteobacteria bacterium]